MGLQDTKLLKILISIIFIFVSQYANANIQLNCLSEDYRIGYKGGNARNLIPIKHSHSVFNNEIIYKVNNKTIKKAPISFGDYDDKIVGVYKFKSKKNFKFTYFKNTRKFVIGFLGRDIGWIGDVWGTCKIVKLNTHKEKVIAIKPETKNLSNSTEQFEQEKQKRIELEKKLAALEKQQKKQQSKPKAIIATNSRSEFPLQPIPIDFTSVSVKRDDIAVIIGNANYKKMGKDIPNVNPAYADAEGIKQYFMKAKGIKEGNIIFLKDATGAQLLGVFGNEKSHKGKLFNYIKPNKSNVYIYYAGHGAPGKEGDAYLVPTDTDSQTIEFTGYPLSILYSNLGKLPAKSMTVILEACFSGGSQSGSLISRASPIVIPPQKTFIPNNIKVIAAGSEGQMASWEEDSSHSLFTKYFLKAMSGEGDSNKDGKVSDNELKEYLSDTMTYYARRYYGRDQKVQIHNGG